MLQINFSFRRIVRNFTKRKKLNDHDKTTIVQKTVNSVFHSPKLADNVSQEKPKTTAEHSNKQKFTIQNKGKENFVLKFNVNYFI